MAMVRFFLIAVLVLRAAGVSVAAESPCAAVAARGEVCCMRHQAEAGGDVIGHCGCQAAPDPLGQETSVSTPAPSQVIVTAAMAEGPSVETVSTLASDTSCATNFGGGPIHSPPRLTGSGFRC
jgi:hypothetical protein